MALDQPGQSNDFSNESSPSNSSPLAAFDVFPPTPPSSAATEKVGATHYAADAFAALTAGDLKNGKSDFGVEATETKNTEAMAEAGKKKEQDNTAETGQEVANETPREVDKEVLSEVPRDATASAAAAKAKADYDAAQQVQLAKAQESVVPAQVKVSQGKNGLEGYLEFGQQAA